MIRGWCSALQMKYSFKLIVCSVCSVQHAVCSVQCSCSVQCAVALRLRIPNGCPLWSCSAPCTRQHQPAETLQYLRTNPIFSSTFSPRMTIFSPIGFILNQVNSNLFSPFLMRYFPSAILFLLFPSFFRASTPREGPSTN